MSAISIRDLSFNYSMAQVFNGLNLEIKKDSFTTILGSAGTGKSTLFKILHDDFKYGGKILMLNKSVNYSISKNYVNYISSDIFDFNKRVVIDEFINILKLKGKTDDKIKIEIDRVSRKLDIKDLLNLKIKDLSYENKLLVMFAIALLGKPKIIIIDNVFNHLGFKKKIVLQEILKLNRKKTTIVNITNNSEEALYGDDVIILNDDKHYNILDIDEDFFTTRNLEAPFMISLSSKLKVYNLIDKNYLNMEKLVDDLWQ